MLPEAPASDVRNFLGYCSSLAQEFQSRRNRVRHFVKHNLTSGTANEAILRDFLSSISAGVFAVGEGFICNPLEGTSSRQCDILVHDTRFPRVFSESGVTIVWPESVLSVIEVKTSMTSTDALRSAVQNIISAKEAGASHMMGLIFSFNSLDAETAYGVLSDYPCDRMRPVAVILFDQGTIIQQAGAYDLTGYGGGSAAYEFHKCIGDDPSGMALTYLLLFFVGVQLKWAPGFSSKQNLEAAMHQFLRDHCQLH
jgi:hypothetical protein